MTSKCSTEPLRSQLYGRDADSSFATRGPWSVRCIRRLRVAGTVFDDSKSRTLVKRYETHPMTLVYQYDGVQRTKLHKPHGRWQLKAFHAVPCGRTDAPATGMAAYGPRSGMGRDRPPPKEKDMRDSSSQPLEPSDRSKPCDITVSVFAKIINYATSSSQHNSCHCNYNATPVNGRVTDEQIIKATPTANGWMRVGATGSHRIWISVQVWSSSRSCPGLLWFALFTGRAHHARAASPGKGAMSTANHPFLSA
ncbi:uncharacterized protein LOC142575209 [Dermacentor variabilis]|uniref:uncharacterized protein LOC142575209 n=1 Tax=Dermacentor variabilis TaxID=34621 RepID=UPI003F5C8076